MRCTAWCLALAVLVATPAITTTDADAWRLSQTEAKKVWSAKNADRCGAGPKWGCDRTQPRTVSCPYRIGKHSWYCDLIFGEFNWSFDRRKCSIYGELYHRTIKWRARRCWG